MDTTSSSIHSHNLPGGGMVAYLPGAESSVYIRPTASTFTASGTPVPLRKLQTTLDVAPWGEDNRFPQHIAAMLETVGIARPALHKKVRRLYGQGILPCLVLDSQPDAGKEVIQPLPRKQYQKVYDFVESIKFTRFMLEYLLDWVTYANCFPEGILSKDGKTITGWVHQESCDCRFRQMDEQGRMNTVLLSKLWGLTQDQYIKFGGKKAISGISYTTAADGLPTIIDNQYIKALRAIDPYNPLESLQEYTKNMQASSKLKSFILPVNFPSANKTYYQLPVWDGARVAGWFDIAAAIPNLIRSLLNNAFHIKYHIEIPENYFKKRVGEGNWEAMGTEERGKVRTSVLQEMKNYLQGTDKAGSALITEFETHYQSGSEYGRVKITELSNKINIDKEFLASASANHEILTAFEINPDEIGAGVPGSAYGGNKGGSNIREGSLLSISELKLEREVLLAPLYLTRDYNGWGSEVQFRFRDTILTTLDQSKQGTQNVTQ